METKKIKTIGKRTGEIAPTFESAKVLMETMRQLRGGKGICPRGVYRFRCFENANEWMISMIARTARENQP